MHTERGSNALVQHLDLSGSPVDSRCCDLISDLDNLRVLRLEDCPSVDTAAVVSVLARRRKTLVQFDCGNKLQGYTDNLRLHMSIHELPVFLFGEVHKTK